MKGDCDDGQIIRRADHRPLMYVANRQAKALAEKEHVEIRYYSIIYNLLDEIKGVLEGMLAPERKETFIGYAEVLEVFHIHNLVMWRAVKSPKARLSAAQVYVSCVMTW